MVRRSMTVLLLALGICLGIGRDARAQDTQTPAAPAPDTSATIAPVAAVTDAQPIASLLPDLRHVAPPAESYRSPLLTFLYGFTVGTQVMDVHSTRLALQAGAYEQNPFMKTISVHTSGLIATKAAMTVGTIMVADAIARHHKKTAIFTLVAINVAYVSVVQHNYAISQRIR